MSKIDKVKGLPMPDDSNACPLKLIESVADVFRQLWISHNEENLWFRGQDDATFPLVPKAFRAEYVQASERDILNDFKQKACLVSGVHPVDEWGWIILGQHYGLPTRLLDWSDNPLQALYFACQPAVNSNQEKQDGKLFVLEPDKMNRKTLGDSAPSPILLEEREDKCRPYLPDNDDSTGNKPIAVVAMDDFPRIGAQNGCFTVCSDSLYQYDDQGQEVIRQFIIPAEKKEIILEELDFLGVDAASTYPDLDHLAQQVAKRHANNKDKR